MLGEGCTVVPNEGLMDVAGELEDAARDEVPCDGRLEIDTLREGCTVVPNEGLIDGTVEGLTVLL